MKYIFVHIPKTAGTSFKVSLAEKLLPLWDYGGNSEETSELVQQTVYSGQFNKLYSLAQEKSIDFISGHFYASKYKKLFPKAKIITFVREPIDRFISEYNHHVRHGGCTQSIESFCSNSIHLNRQYNFFSNLDIEDFYFIGSTKQYSKSLAIFNELTDLKVRELNMNIARQQTRSELEISRSDLDSETIQIIQKSNSKDITLYEDIKAKSRHFSNFDIG